MSKERKEIENELKNEDLKDLRELFGIDDDFNYEKEIYNEYKNTTVF